MLRHPSSALALVGGFAITLLVATSFQPTLAHINNTTTRSNTQHNLHATVKQVHRGHGQYVGRRMHRPLTSR